MNSTVINLFVSFATLLAGDPTDCLDPTDASDVKCVGGAASVKAVMRHSQNRGDGPSLHIPELERRTKFVQVSGQLVISISFSGGCLCTCILANGYNSMYFQLLYEDASIRLGSQP